MIKGIADLRLETPDKYHIIDFKTGNHDARQMVFYELYYYLLDEPFWQIKCSLPSADPG
jgi:ATP-dependent exoDNAse (exonuclease V) beta subunit